MAVSGNLERVLVAAIWVYPYVAIDYLHAFVVEEFLNLLLRFTTVFLATDTRLETFF